MQEEIVEYPAPPEMKPEESAEVGIIKELSPKKVLEQLRMNMKGFFYDYENKRYVRLPGYEPLMNDKGVAKYLSIVGSVITDLVTFSNYKESEILADVDYICSKAIPVIHINYKEYGIKEKSDLPIIDIQLYNLTKAAFKKALGAGDRNVVRGTVSESMATRLGYGYDSLQRSYPKRGILDMVNPFSKKERW